MIRHGSLESNIKSMIRGPEVLITYDSTKFPNPLRYINPRKSELDPLFIESHQSQLFYNGDISVTDYDFYFGNSHVAERITSNMLKITYMHKFIKRTDLQPRFVTIKNLPGVSGEVIVDGEYFPSMKVAFLTMFTIDGETIVPKPWKPYSQIVSAVDLFSNAVDRSNCGVISKETTAEETQLMEKLRDALKRIETLEASSRQQQDTITFIMNFLIKG